MSYDPVYVGIDWSISSPAWCVTTGYDITYHFFLKKEPKTPLPPEFIYHLYPINWSNTVERYISCSDPVLESISVEHYKGNISIALEGYAFGGSGMVFNIAESAGLLKHRLWTEMGEFPTIYPPSFWKKFQGMKGNEKKEPIVQKYIDETGKDLYNIFNIKRGIKNLGVIADIADSYFITKTLEEETQRSETK